MTSGRMRNLAWTSSGTEIVDDKRLRDSRSLCSVEAAPPAGSAEEEAG